jgi:hypothetical protein
MPLNAAEPNSVGSVPLCSGPNFQKQGSSHYFFRKKMEFLSNNFFLNGPAPELGPPPPPTPSPTYVPPITTSKAYHVGEIKKIPLP